MIRLTFGSAAAGSSSCFRAVEARMGRPATGATPIGEGAGAPAPANVKGSNR
jgi:hypothetical protein